MLGDLNPLGDGQCRRVAEAYLRAAYPAQIFDGAVIY